MGGRCFRPEACAAGRRRRRRLGCCAPALALRRACSGGGSAGGGGGTRGGCRHLRRRRSLFSRPCGRACIRCPTTPSADGRRRTIRRRGRLCRCSLRCPIRRRPRRRWWLLCRSSRGRGGRDETNLLWRSAVLRRVGLRARAAWWCHTEHGRLVRPSRRAFDARRLARHQHRALSPVAKHGRDARGARHRGSP